MRKLWLRSPENCATLLRTASASAFISSATKISTLHNVVAELSGQSSELVLVTAHLDSIARPGNPTSDPAPGADDDMSGVAGVLAIAERFIALSAADRPLAQTVQFVLFNDEENGLVGSKAYARQLSAAGAQIAGMFQMDMIGFNQAEPRTWELHVGFSPSPETEARSLPLADLIARARAARFACVARSADLRPR